MANIPPVTSGLQLLLDPLYAAASGTTITVSGTTVATVPNQSGVGSAASVPSGYTGPIWRSGVFGSRPSLRFGGGSTCLSGTFSGWGAAGVTVCMALNGGTTSGNSSERWVSVVPAGGTDSSSAGGCALIRQNNTSTLIFYSGNTMSTGTGGTIAVPNQPTVVAYGYSASGTTLCVNGAIVATAAGQSTAAAAVYVMGQYYSSGSLTTGYGGTFDLGMRTDYNRLLTNAEMVSVSQWMMQQIGTATASTVIVVED